MAVMLQPKRFTALLPLAVILCLTGCTSVRDYIHNGFKVGPNCGPPPAPVAEHWIDANDRRVVQGSDNLSQWWTVFNDPKLNGLITTVYQQNLSLRDAGLRILEARAQLAITRGDLFPQLQTMTGSYTRSVISLDPPGGPAFGFGSPGAAAGAKGGFSRGFSQWAYGFNMAWELDFWGRFRRAIIAQEHLLDASVHNYDQVLVTLLGDVAGAYVQIRTDQERIRLLRKNLRLQLALLKFTEARLANGKATQIDVDQVRSTAEATEAQIPQLEIDMRQANNQLCVLLGIPVVDLLTDARFALGSEDIPIAPPEAVVGIPADLLRRRPDVRQAESLAMAQGEQIGIAEAALYPAFSISGSLGYSARQFSQLFTSAAFNGNFGPSFNWEILNYGRLINNVRLQEATFQDLVVTYQNTVLQADADVENGIVNFLQAHQKEALLNASAAPLRRALALISRSMQIGAVDYTQVVVIAQNLVTQEDLWAQARGQITQGLIQVYRAVGGGWDYRGEPPTAIPAPPAPPAAAQPLAPPVPAAPK